MAPQIKEPPPGILGKVNPFAILIGMGFASFFTWFISGGGGGDGRRDRHRRSYGKAG